MLTCFPLIIFNRYNLETTKSEANLLAFRKFKNELTLLKIPVIHRVKLKYFSNLHSLISFSLFQLTPSCVCCMGTLGFSLSSFQPLFTGSPEVMIIHLMTVQNYGAE